MAKPITLYSAAAGLNTILDPQRLSSGSRENPGSIELAQAVNVSIDERGLVSLRNGDTSVQSGAFHSLFCDGGDCFVVQDRTSDAAIFKVNSDFTLTGVRSGLTKGLRVAWAQVNADTFYSNGTQNGFIRESASNAWPTGVYSGPEADLQFTSTAPVANHMAFRSGGQCLLAVADAVFINHAPFHYGLFNLRKGYIGFESPVVMLADVRDGVFVSDGKAVWFFRKLDGDWYAFKQEMADDSPAIEWSLAHEKISLRDAGFEANGFGRIWCSEKGICLGLDDGSVVNLSDDKVQYPTTGYTYGACLVKDKTVINTIT